ncbi:hypothetical protein K2D_06610 [Planctomycetes bacterium K2D]|uniref:Uncharacterized protein n=1 Tax=Botrimarina mediterranea TaxID=2528022 RepID=A0A518K3Y3_9BACT|nr:hypothetical protein Spa11_06800 [Botrimarina mediterranea]QDV77074.1 hypothetical protein K2D_06610 [Planctomycetes bacterium K2D]
MTTRFRRTSLVPPAAEASENRQPARPFNGGDSDGSDPAATADRSRHAVCPLSLGGPCCRGHPRLAPSAHFFSLMLPRRLPAPAGLENKGFSGMSSVGPKKGPLAGFLGEVGKQSRGGARRARRARFGDLNACPWRPPRSVAVRARFGDFGARATARLAGPPNSPQPLAPRLRRPRLAPTAHGERGCDKRGERQRCGFRDRDGAWRRRAVVVAPELVLRGADDAAGGVVGQ